MKTHHKCVSAPHCDVGMTIAHDGKEGQTQQPDMRKEWHAMSVIAEKGEPTWCDRRGGKRFAHKTFKRFKEIGTHHAQFVSLQGEIHISAVTHIFYSYGRFRELGKQFPDPFTSQYKSVRMGNKRGEEDRHQEVVCRCDWAQLETLLNR